MRHRFSQTFKSISAVCAMTMAFACVAGGCGKTATSSASSDDDTVYTIGIISENGNEALEQGFKDACTAQLGEKHVNIVSEKRSDGDGTDEASALTEQKAGVILTESDTSLSGAYTVVKDSDDTSIVSVNVQDVPRAIGTSTYKDPDDRTTGVNVTGISSMPYVEDQLSELIEATSDMKSVGIMYSPDDTDTVKIDRQLEAFLTEAGIEYREYIIPSQVYSSVKDDDSASSTAYINTIKNSDDIDPTVAQMSENFGRVLHPDYTDEQLLEWERKARKSLMKAPASKIIRTAVNQNSALFVAGGSLDDHITDIVDEAKADKKPVFGGDEKCGSEALVTLWCNPYDVGYRAGQMACQIVSDGQKAADMTVIYQNRSSYAKLYNSDYAKALGIEFPKSFHEYYAYKSMSTPGTNDRRDEN